jgi:polyprenyl P-hydroxybenzoate/phenylacrylic acid decarboxylase-like protein
MRTRTRLIVAVTAASAPQLAWSLLEALQKIPDVETHLVLSRQTERTLKAEMDVGRADFEALAEMVYEPEDVGAAIASGSFVTAGMVIVPCSMKTLAAVANGFSADLVARAADVCLKERRRLVLVTRETPLSLIHIRNMEAATLAGAVVLPPVPAFYHHPHTIDDLLRHTAGKILDQFGIDHGLFVGWH